MTWSEIGKQNAQAKNVHCVIKNQFTLKINIGLRKLDV